jgi:hypothetical protein
MVPSPQEYSESVQGRQWTREILRGCGGWYGGRSSHGPALFPRLLPKAIELFRNFLRGIERGRRHELPIRIQDNDSRNRHFPTLEHLAELVGVRPADDHADELLRRFEYGWVIQDLRERTALEAGRRSSRVRTGEADQHQLAVLFGGRQGGIELANASILPGELLALVLDLSPKLASKV